MFTFKAGVVEGSVVALTRRGGDRHPAVEGGADLEGHVPHQRQAQRLVTVISAVPRNLAVVVKQIGEQKGGGEAA